jgi:hypothetical protein
MVRAGGAKAGAPSGNAAGDRGNVRHPRGGLIHEVEVFPFVTIPYGLGNGW